MNAVSVIERQDLSDKRLEFGLVEDRLGHYPEFRMFFAKTFDLERKGLADPGFVRAPSGIAYALVFIGRSGEPFPCGLEISAVVDALEPINGDVLDRDLWAILRWMIGGVGGAWTVEDLDKTGRLYRAPAASS